MNHLISMDDLSIEKVFDLFKLTDKILKNPKKYSKKCKNNIVANLFFEPSTRTFVSFYSAAKKLGASVVPIVGVNYSSIMKGESLEDTIKTISQYSDLIVMRHPEKGSVFRASKYSDVPIINAGDGEGEHPTQALLDLYTIYREKKSTKNLKICFIGDLKYSRTVHSLAKLMKKFNNEFVYVSPKSLRIQENLIDNNDIILENYNFSILKDVDVFYITRIQKERHKNDFEVNFDYHIDSNFLEKIKKDSIIMHPLPRVNEISVDVDDDNRAVYFKQVKYGLYVRMAILYKFLSKSF